MELLRKIGQGCRQHYEKILLTLALITLLGAVLYLQDESQREQQKLDDFLTVVQKRSNKSNIRQADFSAYELAMKLAQNPPVLNFSMPHNLFNPVKWQRRPNNELVKVQTGGEVGWPQMSLTKVTPLNFTISLFKAPSPSGAFFTFTREASDKLIERRPQSKFFSVNGSNVFQGKVYILRELKGAPENPVAVMEFTDPQEKVTIATNQPYVKVEGYEAELKYTMDGKTFSNLRVGSTLRFLGETYNIVAISPNEVVASGQNEKKYPVRQTAGGR